MFFLTHLTGLLFNFTGLLVFKSLHDLTPSYISELICFSENVDYNLRSNKKLAISHKRPNSNYLTKTFSYSSMEIWNEIPVDIRLTQNVNTFKLKLKTYLFENQKCNG